MKRKIWTTAIASSMVLAMTMAALPAQILKSMTGRSSVVNADGNSLSCVEVSADSPEEMGSDEHLPAYGYYEYGYSEQIYTAAEMGNADMDIVALAYDVTSAKFALSGEIYLCDTDITDFADLDDSVPLEDATLVYSGDLPFDQSGWVALEFNESSFHHSKDKNLVVITVNTTGTWQQEHSSFAVFEGDEDCSILNYTDYQRIEPGNIDSHFARGSIKNCIRFYSDMTTKCSLSYDANGGVGDSVVISLIPGEKHSVSEGNFTREGYMLTSWNTKEDGTGTRYEFGDSIAINADTILYAQWDKLANVTYFSNNGSGDEVSCSFITGDTAKITDPGFVCRGYVLSCWNTMPDGSGDSYSLGDEFVLESDIELYAQWVIASIKPYDFETYPVDDGWTFIDYDGDGNNWGWPRDFYGFTTHSGDDSSVLISYSYYSATALTPDNWAIAPAGIVDPDGTMTVTLWAIGQDPSWAEEHFAIYAQEVEKVDLDNFNPGDWKQISDEFIATADYQMYTGDLSEFAGKAVYVAIRHYNVSDMFALNIDDVVLPLVTFDPLGEVLEGYSVSLDGDIAVNFYMSLAADVVERGTAEMVFTVPNGEKTEKQVVKLSELGEPEEVNGKVYYVFKCKVSAKDMASDITAQLVDGGLSGKEYTCSVKAYAEYLLNHPSSDAQTDLVKALLNYGTMAQTYFGVNTGNLANSSFSEEAEQKMSGITAEKISQYAVNNVALPDDVVFAGATLSLKSETTLSLYFTSNVELAFACEDYPIETVKVGNYQVVRIRGIKAWDLAEGISVNVTSSEEGTVTYSPMTYCYNVLNGQYDGDLQNLCKALVMFYAGADALIHPAA